MKVIYNITDRKPFVQALAEITGVAAVYMRTPTYAYKVDYFTVTREGNLEFDDMADSKEIENVLEQLGQRGYHFLEEPQYDSEQPEPEMEEPLEDCPSPYGKVEPVQKQEEEIALQEEMPEILGLIVTVPIENIRVGNLTNLLEAKGGLIKKALGIEALPIEMGVDKVSFPWFSETPDSDAAKAYTHFISALCEMSVKQKRITAAEKQVENEKYAFRCFLLRLGFIGAEYKTERKILLQNLSGNSAFKNGTGREAADDEVSEQRNG